MSTSTYYAATHSSGRVHLRKSTGRVYTHAVVGARFGSQSFCGRLDLARKAIDNAGPAFELVEARPITKEEFNALTKASKQKFSARFMGKLFTKTVDGASAPITFAIGHHVTAHTRRSPVNPSLLAARIEQLKAIPELHRSPWHADNVASNEAALARGYFENQVTESVHVTFTDDEKWAKEILARHCTPGFHSVELLQLVAA